jgi:Fe-S-cluster containining protein
MASAVVELNGLRKGVAGLHTPRGVLFHDAYRWRLYLVGHEQQGQAAFDFLKERGLVVGAEVPAEVPRTSQTFLVDRNQAPDGEVAIAPGARFQCSACGTSCRSFKLGPLYPADVERLLQLDWSGTPHDRSSFFVDREGNPVDAAHSGEMFLRRIDSACQFLQPDNLCGVHARFGAQAKPHMCRAFPLLLRSSPAGIVAGQRLGECSRADETRRGPPPEVEAVRSLWSEMPKVPLIPPLFWIAPGTLVSWREYELMEEELRALPAQGGAVEFLLRALAALAGRAKVALPKGCALDRVRDWAVEPVGTPLVRAARLDPAAAALEEHLARLAFFGKDAFSYPDLLEGVAVLLLAAWLVRERAFDRAAREGATIASAQHVNDATRALAPLPLHEHLTLWRMRPLAAAAAIAAR